MKFHLQRSMRLLILFSLCLTAWANDFRSGAAAVSITPPAGVPMAGYYSTRLAEGTHDELFSKALVLAVGTNKVALIACDLVSLARPVVEEARQLIESKTGIPQGNVMISATHSHTGPVLVGRSARDSAEAGQNLLALDYIQTLPRRIAESVEKANDNLAPSKALAAVGREENLAFNRRFFMRDGKVGWNPGKLNPQIIRPAGPIDAEVPVLYFESNQGSPILTYVNFAMHLDTVGGMLYSADYPYTLASLLSRIKTKEMVTLFTIGTAGDINHIDVNDSAPQKGHEEAQRIGTILAGEVVKCYARFKPVVPASLRVQSRMVELPLAEVKPEEVEEAREVVKRPNAPFLDRVKAFKVLDVMAREGKPLEVEVQAIALGKDVAWVSLPGEIFVELGLAIKRDSPFPVTVLAELANGSIGYIPTVRGYDEGNYEPISARCGRGSGEMLVKTALALLRELRQE